MTGAKIITLIARFMGPTWGPSGADRTQVFPILAPWNLLSGKMHVVLAKCLLARQISVDNPTINNERVFGEKELIMQTFIIL